MINHQVTGNKNITIILGLIRILNIKIKNVIPSIMKLTPIEGRGKMFKITYKKKSFT